MGSLTNYHITVLVLLMFLTSSCHLPDFVEGANFATHGGLAECTLDNEFFVAGAFLADVGYFLPGSPASDTPAFASGLIERARHVSNELRLFAMGWYEHLDQDSEFFYSVQTIRAVHPEYTASDIRLGFDYLSVTRHPTDVNVTFVMNNTEIVEAIRAGFVGVTTEQVQQAIWDFVHSYSAQQPGLLFQMDAAMIFAALYTEKVAEMEAEYESYFTRVTSSYYNPFRGDFTNEVEIESVDFIRNILRILLRHPRKASMPEVAR